MRTLLLQPFSELNGDPQRKRRMSDPEYAALSHVRCIQALLQNGASRCVKSLSSLLRYEDQAVADGAPKYFALLADRFIRKGLNPAPLAENGRMDSQGKKTQRQLIECIRSKDTDVETGQV